MITPMNVKFLFNLGSLMVYEAAPGYFTIFQGPVYFYKYQDQVDLIGPFESIFAATRHWENSLKDSKTMPMPIQTNLIRVDFKNKRRIK